MYEIMITNRLISALRKIKLKTKERLRELAGEPEPKDSFNFKLPPDLERRWRVLQYDIVPKLSLIEPFITWILESVTLFMIIYAGFGMPDKTEAKIALFVHAFTCVIATVMVCWNTQHWSIKDAVLFTALNILLLRKPVRCLSRLINWYKSKPGTHLALNDENKILMDIRQLNCQLQSRYGDMLVSFFSSIPLAFLQANFFLLSEKWLSHKDDKIYWQFWVEQLRPLYVLVAPFNFALMVVKYEVSKQEYRRKLYELQSIRSGGYHSDCYPKYSKEAVFRANGIRFLDHLFTLYHRFYLASFLLAISPGLFCVYLTSLFLTNYTILQKIPEFEEPYLNPPLGISTRANYWTTRIINTLCTMGTRFPKMIDMLLFHKKNKVPLMFTFLQSFVCTSLVYFASSCQVFYFPFLQTVDVSSQCVFTNGNANVHVGYQILIWLTYFFSMYIWLICCIDDMHMRCVETRPAKGHFAKLEVWDKQGFIFDTYPLVTGYTFYKILLGHLHNQKRENRLYAIREFITVSSMVPEAKFYKNLYQLKIEGQKYVEYATDLISDKYNLDYYQVIEKIEECREKAKQREFPFLKQFDYLEYVMIKDNESEERKLKDLKLLYDLYVHFDTQVGWLTSDKLLKIFEMFEIDIQKASEDFEVFRI